MEENQFIVNLLNQAEWEDRLNKFMGHFMVRHPEVGFVVVHDSISFDSIEGYELFRKEYDEWSKLKEMKI